MNPELHPAIPDTTPRDDWAPRRLDPGDLAQQRTLARLRTEIPPERLHDRIRLQLAELMEVRRPAATLSPLELAARVHAHLGGQPAERHGAWFHYGWSGRLVHVLPRDEYDEVRLARNRLKITAPEQACLRRLRIGIVGLSVGQASAVTLAMEGIGGVFRLADFDALSLSNMNRVRAGIHDLGVPKSVLTARQLFEIDPYLDVTLFPHGLAEAGIDGFLLDGGRLDLLIEECDDLPLKIALRERARAHRIPVLMETSDRGMLDVERFDLEPDRPVLHGRLGAVRARDLRAMSPAERVSAAMAIVGTEVSPRLAASAVEIGSTLRSWPQLASAVSLGAAVIADTARRIALDEFRGSGRYHIDLDHLVRDTDTVHSGATPPESGSAAPPPAARPKAVMATAGIDAECIRRIVTCACAAPSGGNAQPWRFRWDGRQLRMRVDPARAGALLDFDRRATWLALGAAAENAVLAAGALGLAARWAPHGIDDDGEECRTLALTPMSRDAAPDPLHAQILHRCTNRRLGERVPLPDGAATALRAAADARGGGLLLLEGPESMDALGAILGRGDRLRFLSRTLHGELMREIRWTPREVEATRDGIDLRTLELGGADLAALRLTATWRVMELVGGIGGGRNLEKFAQRTAAGSSAFGLLTIPGSTRGHFFEGGRALQRVWLTATALGLALQPLAALPYLFMRALAGGMGLSVTECRALTDLQREFRALMPLPEGHADALLFRLGVADPPSARALRLSVDTVLDP